MTVLPMSETVWKSRVISIAEEFGWQVTHVGVPMRPVGNRKFVPEPRGAGLTDLILTHDDPARLIFAELKKDGKYPKPEQRAFMQRIRVVRDALDDYGLRAAERPLGVYVWRPADESTVETILRSKVLA